jgi:predicted dinucleotide-binding enzyme
MDIGILGTGIVGRTLGTRLVEAGHTVKMGSRAAGNEKAIEWARSAGPSASEGSFADAAEFGDVAILATSGYGAMPALQSAAPNLDGKTLLDVTNPLDTDKGFPPPLIVSNTDSLGEQLQRAFPDIHIVKTLNTMNCAVMANPQALPSEHNVFVNGNDEQAKKQAKSILHELGWPDEWIIDLGDITASRGVESAIHLWLSVVQTVGDANFNLRIVRP